MKEKKGRLRGEGEPGLDLHLSETGFPALLPPLSPSRARLYPKDLSTPFQALLEALESTLALYQDPISHQDAYQRYPGALRRPS